MKSKTKNVFFLVIISILIIIFGYIISIYMRINNRLNNTDINDKCLMCHKYNNNYKNIIINNHAIQVNNPIRIYKNYCKNIIIAIALILLLIIIIVYIILIKR